MSGEMLIAGAAIAISVLTFVAAQLTQLRSAKKGQVNGLEERLVRAEGRLKEAEIALERCHTDSRQLRDENIELMRRLLALEDR